MIRRYFCLRCMEFVEVKEEFESSETHYSAVMDLTCSHCKNFIAKVVDSDE